MHCRQNLPLPRGRFFYGSCKPGRAFKAKAQRAVLTYRRAYRTLVDAVALGTRNGRVVGSSALSGDLSENAFAWSLSTGMLDLGSLGGPLTYASALSGRHIAGTGRIDEEQWRGFRWSPSTGMVALPVLPGGTVSSTSGIDGDLIAGYSTTSIPGHRPIIWRTDGTLIIRSAIRSNHAASLSAAMARQERCAMAWWSGIDATLPKKAGRSHGRRPADSSTWVWCQAQMELRSGHR